MEGLTEFVSKSFEEKSKGINETADKCLKNAENSSGSRESSPVQVCDDMEENVPKDLSMVKIDVCSSRPETPEHEHQDFDSGKDKKLLVLYLFTLFINLKNNPCQNVFFFVLFALFFIV